MAEANKHPAITTALELLRRAINAGHLHPADVAAVLRHTADQLDPPQQQPASDSNPPNAPNQDQ